LIFYTRSNVDDLNLIETLEKLIKTVTYLNKEFEMKDLEKTKFFLGQNFEHFPEGFSLS